MRAAATRRRAGLGLLLAAGTAALAGCGFQLRQAPRFAFDTLRLAGSETTPVALELRRQLRLNGLTVIGSDSPTNAAGDAAPQVVLTVLQDQRERRAVGQTAAGQVRELQLRTRFRFRLRTLAGRDLIDETELLLERDLSFSETAVLSKASEEERLYLDMADDIVQQVIRRLAAVGTR